MSAMYLEAVIVALISLAGSALGSLFGIVVNAKLTNYRIEQLEIRVNKHNNLIERTYELEKTTRVQAEKIAAANHRIENLERRYENDKLASEV